MIFCISFTLKILFFPEFQQKASTVNEKKTKAVSACMETICDVISCEYFFREIFYSYFNTASSCALQIPLCLMMLGLNPELAHLWHWQSDALTTAAR
jgi:hypothetical protein